MKGGYAMNKIKVLWMNNGEDSLRIFATNSTLRYLDIVTCRNMKECSKILSSYSHKGWDAIVLDAEPRMEEEIPKSQNLSSAYKLIYRACLAPVFVVTANKMISSWDKREAKRLSDGKFYELQKSASKLYEDIKAEVENNENYQIRREHERVFDFYLSIDDSKSDVLLLKLLKNLRNNDFPNDPLVPANVRLILDQIMTYLSNIGMLQDNTFNGSNLRECSIELGKKGNVVPYHIQRCFHLCVDVANNGNHQIPIGEEEYNYKKRIGNPLYVHKQIVNCKAPYLNQALVYDLLNILYWCSTL